MSRIIIRVLMATIILSCIGVTSGCEYRGNSVAYKDLSGPFFKKEIGCTIYFVLEPYHETKGLRRHLEPITDLYAIKPDGRLERQYVPTHDIWASDFVLTDYGYPIYVWGLDGRMKTIENKDKMKDTFKFDWVGIKAVSFDGKRALTHAVGSNQETPVQTLDVIDLISGEILFTVASPWEFTEWSCRGADNGLKNILAMRKSEEGSHDKEMRTWWEPYLFHFDDENKLTCKMLQFPPPEPMGINDVKMIPYDGRIIGVTHDGQTARFYQSYPPYDEFTLLLSLELAPVEIASYSRDGLKLLLTWVGDDSRKHYIILDMQSKETAEMFAINQKARLTPASLSPKGDRLVLLTISSEGAQDIQHLFSVYDTLSGELVDSAEWPYKGFIQNMSVGY